MSEFIIGFVCCELLWFIINIMMDIKQQKQDMKELEKYNDNIEQDLRFSSHVCQKINEINSRLEKLENKEEK